MFFSLGPTQNPDPNVSHFVRDISENGKALQGVPNPSQAHVFKLKMLIFLSFRWLTLQPPHPWFVVREPNLEHLRG